MLPGFHTYFRSRMLSETPGPQGVIQYVRLKGLQMRP